MNQSADSKNRKSLNHPMADEPMTRSPDEPIK
jgi:hypothetical protein